MQEKALAEQAHDVGEIACEFDLPRPPAGFKSPWFQPWAFAFDG